MNASEVLVACMEKSGIRRAYGLIGTTLLGFMDALHARRNTIRYISARHEQVAASMADGDARVTGRPAVVFLHSGPGVLNATLSLGIAMRDSVPLIAVAATVRRRLLRQGHSFEVGQIEVVRPLCKSVERVEDPARIGAAFLQAYRTAQTAPCGPVYLEVPEDVCGEESRMPEAGPAVLALPSPEPSAVEEIAAALAQARRPLVLVGGGATEAARVLRPWVESSRIPVITTGQGRGVLPESHPLCFGRAGFAGGNSAADAAFAGADVLLTLGCSLTDLVTYDFTAPCEARIYCVDAREPAEVLRPHLSRAVRCDAVEFLRRLAESPTGDPASRDAWLQTLGSAREEWASFLESYRAPKGESVGAGFAMTRLAERLPTDAIVTTGAGAHTVYAGNFFPRSEPRSYLASTNFGAMSFGLPVALGAALGRPDRTVCAVLGDGDFLMALQDLETAAREKIPVRVVVLNDNSYRVLALRQKLQLEGRLYGSLHTNPDFVALARAFGIAGYRIERSEECDGVFDAALKEAGPVLVEVRIDPEELPPVNLQAVFSMQSDDRLDTWPAAEAQTAPKPVVEFRISPFGTIPKRVEAKSAAPTESRVWPPLDRCRLACFSPIDEARLRGLLARAKLPRPVSCELAFVREGMSESATAEVLSKTDVVIGDYSFRIPITAGALAKAGPIRLIQQPSTGYNHIDVAAATAKRVPVANTATANTESVAEHTVAAALTLLKKFFAAHRSTVAGEWRQLTLGPQELMGKTYSILGLGRIGREVARRVRALGVGRVLYYDIARPQDEQGAQAASLEECLRSADVVSLHLPLTDQTRKLVDRERLSWLRPSAYLVNVGRGELVDEAALVEALRAGRLAGAALDVYESEPLPVNSPLKTLENVLLTPHTAGVTVESQARIIEAAISNVGRAILGIRPIDVVNPGVL